jgi:hypothetical protein
MRDKYIFLTPPEHVWIPTIRSTRRLLVDAGLEVCRVDSHDVVTPDKALRGIGKLLGRELWPVKSRALWLGVRLLTRLAQPLLALAGYLNLGSGIEVYARHQGARI